MRKLHGASQHPVARQHPGFIPTHPNVASQYTGYQLATCSLSASYLSSFGESTINWFIIVFVPVVKHDENVIYFILNLVDMNY